MVIDLARGAELLILEATLENGATDDARRGHLDTPEAIDHVASRRASSQGLLVHYRSERRADHPRRCAPRRACRSSRRVTGMVVDVEPGSASRRGAGQPAWFPPRPAAPALGLAAASR